MVVLWLVGHGTNTKTEAILWGCPQTTDEPPGVPDHPPAPKWRRRGRAVAPHSPALERWQVVKPHMDAQGCVNTGGITWGLINVGVSCPSAWVDPI